VTAGVAGVADTNPTEAMATACFHCGEPAAGDAPHVRVRGRDVVVCCHGCAAAANWINDAGLDDYYRLRVASGNRVMEADADFTARARDDIQRVPAVDTTRGRENALLVQCQRSPARPVPPFAGR